ncbi:hypothetical protein KR059_012819 [Drosophila kikkawai]|nr:hypothetical protein KR059_012819 [Drosophila kikkawai]
MSLQHHRMTLAHGNGGGASNSSASSTSSASGLGLGMVMGLGQSLGQATPPESPNVPISPVHTPPPYDVEATNNGKQLLQKSVSTPMQQEESQTQPRLPVFNRLSSAVEVFQHQSNLGL